MIMIHEEDIRKENEQVIIACSFLWMLRLGCMKRSMKFLPKSCYVYALIEGVIVGGFIVASVELPHLLAAEHVTHSTLRFMINVVMIFFVSFANRVLIDNYPVEMMDNTHWKCIFFEMGIAFLIALPVILLIK